MVVRNEAVLIHSYKRRDTFGRVCGEAVSCSAAATSSDTASNEKKELDAGDGCVEHAEGAALIEKERHGESLP